jgi:hypothetical protein
MSGVKDGTPVLPERIKPNGEQTMVTNRGTGRRDRHIIWLDPDDADGSFEALMALLSADTMKTQETSHPGTPPSTAQHSSP